MESKSGQLILSIVYERDRALRMARGLLLFLGLCEIGGGLLLLLFSTVYVNYVVHPVECANEKQKEFIASVSHELRSPLSVIKVGINSMQDDLRAGDSSKLMKYLFPMDGECIRMRRLIEDMLLLAATDQKNWTIQESKVDLECLLIECYDTFCIMNQEVANKIHIDLSEEDLPEIMGDEERIKQVIMILLDNAMSYTDPKQGIVLRAYGGKGRKNSENKKVKMYHLYEDKHYVTIEVEDHGKGMNDQEKYKIFDSFYRRDHSRTDHKHFGLGLSIAKRLIELHHGTIQVIDTKPHGTTFIIILPCR